MSSRARTVSVCLILLAAASVIGCTDTRLAAGRTRESIAPGDPPIDADFGTLDSMALLSTGLDHWRRIYPQPTTVRWFLPVAHFKSDAGNAFLAENPDVDEWEIVILFGDLEVDASKGRLKMLCMAYFIRPVTDRSDEPWQVFTPQHALISAIEFRRDPVHREDLASYVEQVAYHFYGEEDCLPIASASLANWNLLYGATPHFADPICNPTE